MTDIAVLRALLLAEHEIGETGSDEWEVLAFAAVNALPDLLDETEDYRAFFELRWDADLRAIKRWQDAHPGGELVWPDHADLVIWLLDRIERLEAVAEAALPLTRRTYVDGVVAHVPYDDLYRLRLAVFGSDEAILAALSDPDRHETDHD